MWRDSYVFRCGLHTTRSDVVEVAVNQCDDNASVVQQQAAQGQQPSCWLPDL